MTLRIAFAGGGTGGHIYPAVAVARALDPGSEVVFLGSDKPLERRILEPTGFRHVALPAAPWRRDPRGLMTFVWEQLRGVWAARAELKAFRPHVVVGLGGFVSVPGVVAARTLGVPVALLEPNAVAGLANQVLSHLAEEAYVHFAETQLACPRIRSGTPLGARAVPPVELTASEARRRLGLPTDRPTVLIMGGSQGARSINHWVQRSLVAGRPPAVSFIHLAGNPEAADELEKAYADAGCCAHVTPFLAEIGVAYRAADLAIVRAGAATLAELLAARLPAWVVPLPRSAGDHQRRNAAAFATTGAGTWIEQDDLTPEAFSRAVAEATDPLLLAARSRAAGVAARPDAARQAAQQLERLARRGGSPQVVRSLQLSPTQTRKAA